jgi:hypothetical protein
MDFNAFSTCPTVICHPRELAYDENGVKIYAFPVIHALAGSMGYRLEWNGLTFVYTADSQPSTFEAEQGKGADVFVHEIFPSAEEFAHYNHMPIEAAYGATIGTSAFRKILGKLPLCLIQRLDKNIDFFMRIVKSQRRSDCFS